MTKTQFKEAFKRGLGRSYIELKESSNREKYKDIVLWSCLRNTCFDMQCEGGRGVFLYNAICLFEDRSFFEEAIIQKFMQKSLETWLFDQLCELLYLFSVDGSMKARESLYRKFNTLLGLLSHRTNHIEKGDLERLCVWLTSLDGFPAFKTIVMQLGEFAFRNSETVDMDWFYSNSKYKFGDKRVDTYLEKNAIKSEYINAFLKSISYSEIQNRPRVDPPTVEELIDAAREQRSRSRWLSLRFAKAATEDDLIELAKYAVDETNLEIKLELLWAFRKVRFPLDEQIVFELAESDHSSIRDTAFEMLQHLPSDLIHDYAINLITQKKELANALSLLCHCYRSDDETILFEGIQSLAVSYKDYRWHSVFMDVEGLLDNRSVKNNPSIFVYMYRRTLCSYCRNILIQKMFKRKALPQEILEECFYDSNEDTRKFAVRKLKR